MPRPRGRRPASEGTRERIVVSARAEFADRGYDAATLRGIARRAEVDPALLHHYFNGKAGLFAEVVAIPLDTSAIVKSINDGPTAELGQRVVRTFLSVWESPDGRDRFVALIRSALSNEQAAAALREFLTRELLTKVAARSGVADAELRASLAASHLVGLAIVRYVVMIEPLVHASVDELISLVGPTLQNYLVP
ncbi:TetR/AcrR family transcriptional regulator [Antricoccus suffuscus]|uniref:TetR/AcrR family transcriptional regulator n=1 Tax=Antricoccus suffuscus TaxID=1629062 RepID=UPI000D051C88|nr:TetR family transcriptional regulator [Antricoccus suffuscus]